ncbi:MAG: HipA domain-containing protein [Bermanella sp.]
MSAVFDVYLLSKNVGQLTFNDDATMAFQYSKDYVDNAVAGTPILSVRFPIRSEAYNNKETFIFLSNLFPEGKVMERIEKILRLNSEDIQRLIEVMGGDFAGAIELFPQDYLKPALGQSKKLNETQLSNLINKIEVNPFHVNDKNHKEDGTPNRTRMSLAGAQPKLPVFVEINDDGNLNFYDSLDQPSTHIIKPPRNDKEFPYLVINEYICMTAAARSGLTVAPVTLLDYHNADGDEDTALLVERYDRKISGGHIERIHQEDLCQICGFPPGSKYEMNTDTGMPGYKAGPGIKELFTTIRDKSTLPIKDLQECGFRIFFSIICGNDDAHAKNFSFLHLDNGRLTLTPAYDLVSTQVYPLEHLMAMNFGAVRCVQEIKRSDLDLYFQDTGLGGRQLMKIYLRFCDEALSSILSVIKEVSADLYLDSEIRMVSKLADISTANHTLLVKRLEEYSHGVTPVYPGPENRKTKPFESKRTHGATANHPDSKHKQTKPFGSNHNRRE